MTLGPAAFLGYHTLDSFTKTTGSDRYPYRQLNALQIAGYFPGPSGIIVGIFRLFLATKPQFKEARNLLIFRGTLEILGLGLLFFIVDLIISIGRHFCNSSSGPSEKVQRLQGG